MADCELHTQGADRMSDPDQFRRDVARTKLYLMGDTGVGPEDDRVPLGLTRMSKIAMRRSAHLGEVQHEAAHASFSELRRTPDLAIEGLDGAVEQACERVMERAARIGREAGLDAYQEESYLDAAQGMQLTADRRGRPWRRARARTSSPSSLASARLRLNMKRWCAGDRDQTVRL